VGYEPGGDWFISLEKHFQDPLKGNPFVDLAGLAHEQQEIVRNAADHLQQKYSELNKKYLILED
jgi:hypothetical protein